MPWYNDLRPSTDPNKQEFSVLFPDFPDKDKKRTLQSLIDLRNKLAAIRAMKQTNGNLLIASWNIKEFGKLLERLPESHFYIAEIVASFDLVAIQEIKQGLKDFDLLMKLLGSNWDLVMTDITEGADGNDERFAYVFDKRRVKFSGLAGEILLWKDLDTLSEIRQLKRTPFMTGFQAGWKKFALINVHLQPDETANGRRIRKKEIELLTKALVQKKKNKRLWTDNIILLGDFNLYKEDTEMVALLEQNGFKESDLLKGLKTNTALTTDAPFDRMFFWENEFFDVPESSMGQMGGVVEIFDMLYRLEDFTRYKSYMKAHKDNPTTLKNDAAYKKYFRDYWRKNQLSDHKPIWIELSIDSTDEFLKTKLSKF